ncbi:hypothetical protein [Selenomonas sp.]|uniref:hypothetical protein n=1 Tax=Selenomonas sp. TaxID=2053611 RepID=UPI0039BF06F4
MSADTIVASLQSILFWAGIHGPNVVGGVMKPMLLANSLDNQALLDAGQQRTRPEPWETLA